MLLYLEVLHSCLAVSPPRQKQGRRFHQLLFPPKLNEPIASTQAVTWAFRASHRRSPKTEVMTWQLYKLQETISVADKIWNHSGLHSLWRKPLISELTVQHAVSTQSCRQAHFPMATTLKKRSVKLATRFTHSIRMRYFFSTLPSV